MGRAGRVAVSLVVGMSLAGEARAESPFDLAAGLGVVAISDGTEARAGLALDLSPGVRLNEHLTVNVLAQTTVMYPERTVAMAATAIALGAWTTEAFGSVWRWSTTPSGNDTWDALKVPLSFFAYTGLVMTYLAVPVLLVVSPFASLGQVALGPVVRIDTGTPPDLFVEVGGQAFLYSLPSGDSGGGVGPVLGLGTHLAEALTIGARVTVSPAGWHDAGIPQPGAWISGGVYIGV